MIDSVLGAPKARAPLIGMLLKIGPFARPRESAALDENLASAVNGCV